MSAEELRLLTVHAHADDESITMGGSLAVLHDQGVHTALITCTDGQLATIFDPTMDEAATRPILGEVRRAEMAEAARILGLDEFHFLGYRDSGMAGAETNDDADAFWRVDIDAAVGRVVERIRAFRPQVVVTYDANGGYGHPDHIQAHRVTLLAVAAAADKQPYPAAGPPWQVSKLYYTAFAESAARRFTQAMSEARKPATEPVTAGPAKQESGGDTAAEEISFATPDELISTWVDCADGMGRKLEALRAHRSQIAPDWPLLSLPEQSARELFGTEAFRLIFSRVPTPAQETDLFAGIR
ncbi:MAG: N-acetyl-1-D-myo-inositol-2-amino-2-deoxy-alpha-D-glucopyranoside deacetylase [Candidatus Dormibacteria bacterium]